MELQLFRHATHSLTINGRKLLVDPMLSPAGAMPPVDSSPHPRPNPLVDIRLTDSELKELDAVLLTHTHRDHFDDAAAQRLDKNLPMLCQPPDETKLRTYGFQQVHPIEESFLWQGITFIRTAGQHGVGAIGEKMAPVSGYVIFAAGEPSLYIAGDTIWCPEVSGVLDRFAPDVTILYGGGARFLSGDPITMTEKDILAVCRHCPSTRVVVLHMEAFNHCLLTRSELAAALQSGGLADRVQIPADGAKLFFSRNTP